MGIFKELGEAVGKTVGGIVGGTVSLIGDLVDSDTIRDIGICTYRVTANTGMQVGKFADGAAKCVGAILSDDGEKFTDGAKEMIDTAAETVVGMGKGIAQTVTVGIDGIDAVLSGDEQRVIDTGKKLVKVVAIGALSFSVLDVVDGAMDGSILDTDGDGIPDFMDDHIGTKYFENSGEHYVTPHYRTLSDGSQIWVDGDGNTSIDNNIGWMQSNPDYRG